MKNIFTILLFLSLTISLGQNNPPLKGDAELIKANTTEVNTNTDYNQIFMSVQVPAVPPGGMNAFRKFIATSFKLPEVTEKTTGVVLVKFVVWDDGSIRDFQIIKETPENLGLGKEAIRVISSSEIWEPGKYNDRNVKQYYTLPISLQIDPIVKVIQPVKENDSTPKKE